jgi:hypothetical protein
MIPVSFIVIACATVYRRAVQPGTPSLKELKETKDPAIIETLWENFLIAANGIYSKLERGAKTNGKSKAWYGRKKHERKNDPLLSYLHHARNAAEHGIQRITSRTSTRSLPRTSVGKCGSIRSHCSSLSQNRFLLMNTISSPKTNQYRILGAEGLMSSDPNMGGNRAFRHFW